MTTLKKDLIRQFAAMTSLETMKDSRLVLLTPAIPKEEADPNVASMTKVTSELARGYYKENRLPTDAPLENNDGFFMLKNVLLQSGGTTAQIPFLVVFFDQVIAVSIIGGE